MKKDYLIDFEWHTFVKDISSGTIYGEGFKNGARSTYISKSSELRFISSIHIPLLETGFANSPESCLEVKESETVQHTDLKRLTDKSQETIPN